MKKILSIFGLFFLLSLAVILSSSTQQNGKGKNKEKQEQGKNNGNGNAKNNNGKGNAGAPTVTSQGGKNKNDRGHNGNDKAKGNNNKEDRGNALKIDRGNNKNDNYTGNAGAMMKPGKHSGKKDNDYYYSVYGYNWNNDNFYDRRDYRNWDKVTICHKFSGNQEPVSINVSENAVKAHLNHGDVIGDCPVISNRRYSDIFYRNRTDYYNSLQNTQEQVLYSRSILDYALARLAGSRTQLITMRNNNAPLADIQRREQSVYQLEQNVSVLQTLIGVAANIVASKLSQ